MGGREGIGSLPVLEDTMIFKSCLLTFVSVDNSYQGDLMLKKHDSSGYTQVLDKITRKALVPSRLSGFLNGSN